MKKLMFILIVAILAYASLSFAQRPVEETQVKVTANYGATMWEICEKHYDKDETRSFGEFVYENSKANGLVGPKCLQAGQVVTITKKVRK